MNYAFAPNPMKVHIFDVEHGECSVVEAPSGAMIMIGAGHNTTTNWRPSAWLEARQQRPNCLVLSNLDRDHLSDLENFDDSILPVSLKHNHYVSPEWVESLKIQESGEVHQNIKTALHWVKNIFNGGSINPNYGVEKMYFYHSPAKFQDTNNLSVVTFVSYNGIGIMFPGDLECAGWQEFLKDPVFVSYLRRTNILIASHHGREGGYCKEVFDYCKPHTVIVSDKPVVHETQNHNLYSDHCSGLNFGGKLRKVLTTRNDGKITIEIPANGNYTVYTNQSY